MNHHVITSNTKVYIRRESGWPATTMMGSAYEGFSNLGAEVTSFESAYEIDSFDDLGPETMVVGYIGDVWKGLEKMGKPLPAPIDYPESLTRFLHRDIVKRTVAELKSCSEPLFIKPVNHKLFTGFIWQGIDDSLSRRKIVQLEESAELLTCEILNMLSEYRAIVLEGEIIDVRRYNGDWSLAPDANVVKAAVTAFENSGEAPAAYTLDFAVAKIGSSHETVLVEVNDGFAFCNYGMQPEAYASCLAARWKELTS